MPKLISILIMLALISLLILVHELGHFLAARMFGIRVSKFAFGLPFGPTLYRRKFGDTEFLVHAFLLGGYISFPDDEEKDDTKEEKGEGGGLPADSPLRFKNKKPWQKAVVVTAGVFANVVCALFLVMFAAGVYHKLPSGDSEVYINEIVKENNASNIEQKGVRPGDRVLSVNGVKIGSSYAFIRMVQEYGDKPLEIKLKRDGQEIYLKDVQTDKKTGLLGVKLESKEVYVSTATPKAIVWESSKYVYKSTEGMLVGLWQLFTGKIPASEMHGIIAITKIGGDIIESHGMLNGLLLTAIISLNLAIINLLPIPALDGGHLLFIFLEKVFGKRLNEAVVDKIANTCFMLLILLMVFVVFNDVFALVTKKF